MTNSKVLSKADLKRLDVAIGKNIKARRIEQKMTQEGVARRCGISFQQIQKYETAANKVSSSRLLQLCEILKTTPDRLLFGAKNSEVKR